MSRYLSTPDAISLHHCLKGTGSPYKVTMMLLSTAILFLPYKEAISLVYMLRMVCTIKKRVLEYPLLGCEIALTIILPQQCNGTPIVEFSNTIMNCVSLHPSRIIEQLMYFKNSHRDATNIPLGVIRVVI